VTRGSLALAHLVAGVQVQQRLIEDRIVGAGLRCRRNRAGGGVAIRHVDAETQVLLDLREEVGEARMRRRRERRDDVEALAVGAAYLLAADPDAEIDHVGDRAPRGCDIGGRGEPGLDVAEQRLDEERIVIGRAVTDLHRLPHRLGDALPGRVDDRGRGRARDEDAREVEQERGVLVAARVQAGQRHDQFAPAKVRIADQVERGKGRQEAVLAVALQQVVCAVADDIVDLRQRRRRAVEGDRRRLRMVECDGVDEVGDGLADRLPVRLAIVAGADERLAQPGQLRVIAQFGQPGTAQQRPQRRIAERGSVELGKMGIAGGRPRQHGIADVVQRGAVFPGGQRAAGVRCEVMKAHEIPGRAGPRPGSRSVFPATPSGPSKYLKNYTNSQELQM